MERRFIYLGAILFLVLGLLDIGRTAVLNNNTDYTTGQVLSIWHPVNEQMKKNNSAWAHFVYTIDGVEYYSENEIQVPMHTKVGDKIEIKYDIRNPRKIYSFSMKRGLILLGVSACLFIIGKFILK